MSHLFVLRFRRVMALLILCDGLLFLPSMLAQPIRKQAIKSDRSLSTQTQVQLGLRNSKRIFRITGGVEKGNNLFHRFDVFSIPQRRTAAFERVKPKIKNVFAHITGSSASNINGAIELLMPSGGVSQANIFLLNPNGIRFGPGVSLNGLQGSLVASTTQSLQFADGTINSTQNSRFSSTAPQTFRTGLNPGRININNLNTSNNGLRVLPQKSLIFIGGEVDISRSRLNLTDARVEIMSLADQQQVGLTLQGTPRLKQSNSPDFSNITFRNNSRIFVSSDRLTENAGIYLSGNRIQLKEASSLQSDTNGGRQDSLPRNQQTNLPIRVQAKLLEVLDTAFIYSNNTSDRLGAPISVQADEFRIDCGSVGSNCAIVLSTSFNSASAGRLDIQAKRFQLLNGGQLYSSASNDGKPGKIRVTSEDIDIDGGFVNHRGLDDENWRPSSILTENKSDLITQLGGETLIQIKTDRLSIQKGGAISTATFNTNPAGNLFIQADQIDISGNAMNPDGSLVSGTLNLPNLPFSSGLFTSVDPNASGSGGTLTVKTNNISLRNGGKIQAATFGSGNAGFVNINANQISVVGQDAEGIFPSTIFAGSGGIPGIVGGSDQATGKGNDVNLTTRTLLVKDGAAIAVGSLNPNAEGSQGAGNLNIDANIVALDNTGQLISNTTSGDGGNINLTGYRDATPMRALFLLNSGQISSTAGLESQGGDGGDINIYAEAILANFDARLNAQGSDITANAFNGTGGNIGINANLLLGLDAGLATPGNQNNDIDASSALGTPGMINISANLVDPTQALVDLPSNTRIPNVARQCDRQLASAPSRFVNLGKGGLAKSPVAYALVNTSWEDLRVTSAEAALASMPISTPTKDELPNAVLEAQGLMHSKTGQLMLVAQVPNTRGTLQATAQSCVEQHS